MNYSEEEMEGAVKLMETIGQSCKHYESIVDSLPIDIVRRIYVRAHPKSIVFKHTRSSLMKRGYDARDIYLQGYVQKQPRPNFALKALVQTVSSPIISSDEDIMFTPDSLSPEIMHTPRAGPIDFNLTQSPDSMCTQSSELVFSPRCQTPEVDSDGYVLFEWD